MQTDCLTLWRLSVDRRRAYRGAIKWRQQMALLPFLLAGASPRACPILAPDRLAAEDAAWAEACAPAGSSAAMEWADFVALHARARRGDADSRVLVFQNVDFAQGIGNNVQLLSHFFRHAMLVRRALFINVSKPVMVKVPLGGQLAEESVHINGFDPGEFMIGRDGVDWKFSGSDGDALAARWRALGMREVRVETSGCSNKLTSDLILEDRPPVGSVEAAAPIANGPAWLSIVGPYDCFSVTKQLAVAMNARAGSDQWERCRINAFTRPRPAVVGHIRSALHALAKGDCMDRSERSTMEPARLVSMQVRTGWADLVGLFSNSSGRGTDGVGAANGYSRSEQSSDSAWRPLERAVSEMIDRARLSRLVSESRGMKGARTVPPIAQAALTMRRRSKDRGTSGMDARTPPSAWAPPHPVKSQNGHFRSLMETRPAGNTSSKRTLSTWLIKALHKVRKPGVIHMAPHVANARSAIVKPNGLSSWPRLQATAFEFVCEPLPSSQRLDLPTLTAAASNSLDGVGKFMSILSEFGGLRAFIGCAIHAASPDTQVSPVHSSLGGFRTLGIPPRTRVHECADAAERANQAKGGSAQCKGGALFLATDAPLLSHLAQLDFAPHVVTAQGVGALLHSGTSLLKISRHHFASLLANGEQLCGGPSAARVNSSNVNCVMHLANMRSVVDWFIISLSDVVFTLAAHWISSYSATAMRRSVLLRMHVEYFDVIPKLLCAERGRCALRRAPSMQPLSGAALAECEHLVRQTAQQQQASADQHVRSSLLSRCRPAHPAG